MSVNKLIIIAFSYKCSKSMTTAAYYKNRVNPCLATRVISPMTSLIIMGIKFVSF